MNRQSTVNTSKNTSTTAIHSPHRRQSRRHPETEKAYLFMWNKEYLVHFIRAGELQLHHTHTTSVGQTQR